MAQVDVERVADGQLAVNFLNCKRVSAVNVKVELRWDCSVTDIVCAEDAKVADRGIEAITHWHTNTGEPVYIPNECGVAPLLIAPGFKAIFKSFSLRILIALPL